MSGRPLQVGLTYDLRSQYLAEGYGEIETAEFDRDDTIDAIAEALQALGHHTHRIGHARQLVDRLAAGERWDLVFNICEGLKGPGREAQVPALLDVYGVPYTFSDPLVLSVSLHKGMTKSVLRDAGVPTPRGAVIESRADLDALDLRYPLFAKPVAEGTGKGIDGTSVLADRAALEQVCERLLAEFDQPVLVEEFLPGREFTVSLLGTGADARVLGTFEILLGEQAEPGAYSYVNKERCEELVEYRLVHPDDPVVAAAEELSLRAWRALGCRDAGRVDLRCNAAGAPEVMELNPLAGLHPAHSDLPMLCTAIGMPYLALIEGIVESARRRVASDGRAAPPAAAVTARPGARVAVAHHDPGVDAGAADADVLVQRDAVLAALRSRDLPATALAVSLDLESAREELLRHRPAVVFNLVESLGGSDRLLPLWTALLDGLRIPYTGSETAALLRCADKLTTKQWLRRAGLPTPDWWRGDAGAAPSPGTYLIKCIDEHASLGITDDCVIETASATTLRGALEQFEARVGRRAMAEVYVPGREFNVSLLEGPTGLQVLPIAEIDFSGLPAGKPHIVGHAAKWEPDSAEYQLTPRRFDHPANEQPLRQRLAELARRAFTVFGLQSYARVDFRVDGAGRPWILEVNANPCLSPDAGFAAAAAEAGMDHDALIAAVLSAAGVPVRHAETAAIAGS